MIRRSRRESRLGRLFDDPFANGLVTLAVVLFVVYVSYTANNGLPFVPTYKVSVDVPNAGQLVKYADVRVGGARVGKVLGIEAVGATEDEPPHARLKLALNSDLRPLAADSRSEVRVASILGGKYVSIIPGTGAEKLRAGEVLPLSRSKAAVDIDEAFRVLDPPTRRALQSTVIELGNAFAGRGVAFNNTVARFAEIAAPMQRVLRNVADPRTNLAGFLDAGARAVETLAPVSRTLTQTLDFGATTLGAVNAAGPALGRSLDELPSAVAQSTTTLTHLGPALRSAATIGRDLQPAARLIPSATRRLDATVRAATPVARDIRTLGTPLRSAFTAVDRFSRNRNAINAIKLLGANDLATVGASGFIGLGGLLSALSDAQLNCNTVGIWARNLSGVLADGNEAGGWLRMIPVLDTGLMFHEAQPGANLHINQYPNQDAQECESGNEPYRTGRAVGNPGGAQSRQTQDTAPPTSATRRARAAGLLTEAPR